MKLLSITLFLAHVTVSLSPWVIPKPASSPKNIVESFANPHLKLPKPSTTIAFFKQSIKHKLGAQYDQKWKSNMADHPFPLVRYVVPDALHWIYFNLKIQGNVACHRFPPFQN